MQTDGLRFFVRLAFLSAPLLVGCSSSTQGSDGNNNDAVVNDTNVTDAPADTGMQPMDVPTDTGTVDAADVPSTVDTMPPTDAPPSDGFGSGCNTLTLTGLPITPDCPTGVAPTPTGGPIALGTYDLTAAHVYNAGAACGAISGTTVAATARFTATVLDAVTQPMGMAQARVSATWSTTGPSITVTPTCPSGGMATTQQYTSDATSVHLFASMAGFTIEEVFTLH